MLKNKRFFVDKDGFFRVDGKNIRRWAIIQYGTKNICGFNRKLSLSGFEEAVTAGNFITRYLDPEYYFLTEKWRIN